MEPPFRVDSDGGHLNDVGYEGVKQEHEAVKNAFKWIKQTRGWSLAWLLVEAHRLIVINSNFLKDVILDQLIEHRRVDFPEEFPNQKDLCVYWKVIVSVDIGALYCATNHA